METAAITPGQRGRDGQRAGIPVPGALGTLLPDGILHRGSAVSAPGDLPLLLALGAAAGADHTAWAAVGLPYLGALAAHSAGLDLACGLWVDAPGDRWPEAISTLADGVPLILLGPVGAVTERTHRRLTGLLRRSGTVLLVAGPWPGAQLRLSVEAASWEGVGHGHGLLRRRRVRVTASGRGAAAAPRTAELWLPGPDGSVHPVAAPAPAADAPRPRLRAVG
ncbi:hypothetical protein [Streptomyces sp. NPDC101455]|uniref:hypothetical protein n=1 Tax=Streptomyces sp. NPDC101455 TaxID=3366142 RepID=UPI003802B7E0